MIMKKTVSFVVACVLAAGASYAASNKSQQPVKQTVVATRTEAPAAPASTGEYDYRLERESCCGPQ